MARPAWIGHRCREAVRQEGVAMGLWRQGAFLQVTALSGFRGDGRRPAAWGFRWFPPCVASKCRLDGRLAEPGDVARGAGDTAFPRGRGCRHSGVSRQRMLCRL